MQFSKMTRLNLSLNSLLPTLLTFHTCDAFHHGGGIIGSIENVYIETIQKMSDCFLRI